MGFKRMISLLLSMVMLLTPVLAMAEEPAFSAGDLTATMLEESYVGGYQINTRFGFSVDEAEIAALGEKAQALAALMNAAQVELSFYDDFGTARIRGCVTLDGVELVRGDALVYEDGSVQLVTSLTGNMAFTLPAGTVTQDGIVLPGSMETLEWTEETFHELPAFDRMRITGSNMISTVLNLLLGWVSSTQMETGELYVFDYDTYIDATETRDAVASRMIGTIRGEDLIRFMWNIFSHIRDREQDFQQALADTLGEIGVTRMHVRSVVDKLFPDELIDPQWDMVQPTHAMENPDAPCTVNDVRYIFVKVAKSLMHAWGNNSLEDESYLTVSYDDFGAMVGFDVDLNRFTRNYPYEGDLVYSIKTDDNWQRLHTAHGELQVYNNNRIVGDLDMQFGVDVGGVNESHLIGGVDIVNQNDGTANGFGVVSALNFILGEDSMSETVEGNAAVTLNLSGESIDVVQAQLNASSVITDLGIDITGEAQFAVPGVVGAAVTLALETTEYDEEAFVDGQSIDLSGELAPAQIDEIKNAVKSAAAGVGLKLAFHPAVMSNALKLIGE